LKVLVTGGAGYLGSVLVPRLLHGGHEVRALDSLMYDGSSLLSVWSDPAFEFVRGDVRDQDLMRLSLSGVDAVVHLAAIVGDPACARDPELARAVNQEASIAFLDAAAKAGARRFIFASTCSNYGRMSDPTKYVDETAELKPVSLYAETKVGVERRMLESPGAFGDLRVTALRFATLYGSSPRMRFDLTVNEFTMELLTKKELIVFGEQFWRPYVHTTDAARAVEAVLAASDESVAGKVFNVGSTEQNFQKQQLVGMILPLAPGASVEYVHRDEDPRDYRVSFEKIERELGFHTTRTVDDGIREVAGLVTSGLIKDFADPRYKN
jgi:nucleoside-diphosphate-sugar epimerase